MPTTKAEEGLKSAREAFERRAYDAAMAHCRSALNYVDTEAKGSVAQRQRAGILLLLSEITDITGQWVDSLLYLDGVTQISAALSDTKLAVESLIRAGKIISKKGKWEDALKRFERAEQLSRKQGIHKLLGKALIGKGTILWRQGQHADAAREAESAAKIGENIGDLQIQGGAHALMASVRFDQGNYAASIDANERALKLFEATKDAYETARVLNNLGETYRAVGNLPEAVKRLETCLRISEESDNKRNAGYALMNIAECKVRLDDPSGAKAAAVKADAIFSALEDRYAQANISMVWGMIHSARREDKNARSCFDKALETMSVLAIPYDMGIIQLEYGKFLSRATSLDEGRVMLKRAVLSFELAGAKEMMARAKKEMDAPGA
ncbi:MAG: tetratricopeptide repeat protein [Methanobacteriota archaeon]